MKKKYLLWFAHEHVDFRFQEIDSLLGLLKINMRYCEEPTVSLPYSVVEFESEDQIKLLASRSISLKSCMELWSKSNTIEGLHECTRRLPFNEFDECFGENKSFKIEVESFSKHYSQQDKIAKIEAFDYLPCKGPVDLKKPDITFQYIEYYGTDVTYPPELPYMVFFGRWITNGTRELIKKLSLKTRKFIGNTSMDAQLSLLMANQAKVKNGDIILDPFVGTGSLLVAAAQFGGYVLGTDIDFLMLHARTKPSRITQKVRDSDEGVISNMKQYGLESRFIDVLASDFEKPLWRTNFEFDAVITDPPYGIREAIEKIGSKKEVFPIKEEQLKTHIPAKVNYDLAHAYHDLLTFCSRQLKIGGRLVCWFPIFRQTYSEDGLPSSTCLKLIANSEQVLNRHTSRRLLTYEKFRHPDPNENVVLRCAITDFRDKYYETREETRKVRRVRHAEINKQGREEAEKRSNKTTK